MSSTATFSAWNIDPAFQAGAIVGAPAGWTWSSNSTSVNFDGSLGSGIDLETYLVSVTLVDSDGDGFIRPEPQDRVFLNGVESGISAVYVGDEMTIDGVTFTVVTFYTDNGNAFSLPLIPGTQQPVQAFAGTMTQTGYIFTSSEVALPFEDLEELPELCLRRGTRLLTSRGEVTVEQLVPGDLVHTLENGLQPLRWIATTQTRRCPVRISAGSLGPGLPSKALVLSRQHRVLVGIEGRALGLVCARALLGRPGIREAPGALARKAGTVQMFHLLFDRHEILLAEGLAVESLLLAPGSLEGLSGAQLRSAFLALGRVPPRPLGLRHAKRGAGFRTWPRQMAPAAPFLAAAGLRAFHASGLHGFGQAACGDDVRTKPADKHAKQGQTDVDVLALPLKHC